jgi:adenylosuccinate synthase
MMGDDIIQLRNDILSSASPSVYTKPFQQNPFCAPAKRPNSVVVEDAFFGDSGKGSVAIKLAEYLVKKGKIHILRYNGGANAGHETLYHGTKVTTHQLPIGIVKEDATAYITRGVVLNPEDLLYEIQTLKNTVGDLPAMLQIDLHTPLALDTHRAKEGLMNKVTTGSKGATGRGIAPAYESVYGRYQVTVHDLLSNDWKDIFTKHYQLFEGMCRGFDLTMAEMDIFTLENTEKKRKIGSCELFLERLESAREAISAYVSNAMYSTLTEAWADEGTPFLMEGAQGIGIDPYHGVYPDITASRPSSHNINDATYGIIQPQDIAVRMAVMKTTYMSSVGQRRLPTVPDEEHEQWVQQTFDERGRSTGRLRDIYPVALPIGVYLRRAAGYDFLAATHLDASQTDRSVKVVSHYTDEENKECPYLPYQHELDRLTPHFVDFNGWDGEAVKQAQQPADLPQNCRTFLSFLSQTLAPVLMASYGADADDWVGWF